MASVDAIPVVGVELLRFTRHHMVTRVARVTPSGRQQTAILAVLPEAVCLLSNRGGLHSYIGIATLASITVHPRSRLCFHSRERHDLLLVAPQAPKIVSTLSKLFAGMTGRELPLRQEEQPPLLDRLRLRPDAHFIGKVPPALVRSLREVAEHLDRYSASSALSALVDINPSSAPQAAPLDHYVAPHGAAERKASLAPHVATGEKASAEFGKLLKDHRNEEIIDVPIDVPLQSPERASSKSPSRKAAARALTILVVQNGNSLFTLPAVVSVWKYICYCAEHLPGAQQPPVAAVHCVEAPLEKKRINVGLLHQTLAMFAESRPHIVTLQKQVTGEGHQFDGKLFWTSLMSTSEA